MSVTKPARKITWSITGLLVNTMTLCVQFLTTGEAETLNSNLMVLSVAYTWWILVTEGRRL